MGRTLVVGIGSPHGDDQAGWLVVERLRDLLPKSSAEFHVAQSPTDLLNWLEDHETLFLVDAVEAADRSEPLSFEFASDNEPACQKRSDSVGNKLTLKEGRTSRGTHGLSVLSVLELARHLGREPRRTIFWLIPGSSFDAADVISDNTRQAIELVALRLLESITDAE